VRIDRFLRNAYTSIRLVAEVTGQSLSAVYQGISLKAEYAVGIFLRFFFAADEADVSEQHTLDVSKNLSESPSAADNDTLTVAKNIDDPIDLTDVDILAMLKALSEAPSISEAHATSITKPFSDAGAVSEDATLIAEKVFADSSAFADNDTLEVTKIAGEDTAQNYCDQSYFLEDYVEGDRIDLGFFTDDNVVSITKFLNDQTFVTDDLDGEASTEDDQEIAFVKTRTDIGIVSESFARTVQFSRDFTDNGAANESAVILLTKPSTDSGVVTDSGDLRSQGYCDFTYFAEDYVGASRTFT